MQLPAYIPSVQSKYPIKVYSDLSCAVETAKGEVRQGKGWSIISPADYGFIEGTRGADGDEMDCYLGPDSYNENVYVVDQNKMNSSQFDEHKVMLGFNSLTEAKHVYLMGHTHGPQIFRNITSMSLGKFKEWLRTGNYTKPLGD